MANVVVAHAFDLRLGSARGAGGINRSTFVMPGAAAAQILPPSPVRSQEEQASIVSNDDEYSHSSGSSSYSSGSSVSGNSINNRAKSLLTRTKHMQKKLKKALVRAANESKRLEEMEREVSTYEDKDGGNRPLNSPVFSGTRSTVSNGGSKNSSSRNGNDNENDSAVHLMVDGCYLPTKYDEGLAHTQPAMTLTTQTKTITAARPTVPTSSNSGRGPSVVYEDVEKLSMRCAKMALEIESKDGKIKQLDEEKQSIVRKFTEAKEHHRRMQRKYKDVYKRICTKQCEELDKMNDERDEMRRQIKERDVVIKQLLDANEKLEAALERR